MRISISEKESLWVQSLAMSGLLGELGNVDFLNSTYFGSMHFGSPFIKDVLKQSRLGNPATFVSMLYMLMVVPEEIVFKQKDSINKVFLDIVDFSGSTFIEDEESIDFVKHITEAVKCPSDCVTFNDGFVEFHTKKYLVNSPDAQCYECIVRVGLEKVGILLEALQQVILDYFKSKI